jgi:CRP-like cAMP-binding protein
MQLKPFEAGRYDDEAVVVSNPVNGKQELFTEREYAVVKFLKQNEKQNLLALLLPNIGIATRAHIEMCLRVLRKLKRMQIVDHFSITGRQPSSDTVTTEVKTEKTRLDFPGLNALAATIVGVAGKALARAGAPGLLGGAVGLAAIGFALFPFDVVENTVRDASVSYALLFAVVYLSACLALSWRTLIQAAYLRAHGREALEPAFRFVPPFVALAADCRAVSLFGFKARLQMAVLGAAAPFSVSCFFSLLAAAGWMHPPTAFVGFAAGAGISLFLLCPVFPYDGAELLQASLFRGELDVTVSTQLREVFRLKGRYERELLFAIGASFAWLFVWLDCVRAFRETLAPRLAADFFEGAPAARSGAMAVTAAIIVLIFLPVIVIFAHHLRWKARMRQRRVVVAKGKVQESLSFEERIAALDKIPLFTYLNDQERLNLQNEMRPEFYKHGDFLVHQGEVGKEFFVLVKGHASAAHTDVSGRSTVLAELVEGDAFGEIALIDDVPRTASIVSEGGCIALVLSKEGFDHFAESLGSPDRVKALVRLTSFFRRHPLFSKLDARDQAQLIDTFRFQTILAGEQVPDGDENFHVVYAGSVRVDTGGGDGETTLRNDDCFGYSNPLSARFVALEGTGLLTVSKNDFHNLIWEKLVSRPELFV